MKIFRILFSYAAVSVIITSSFSQGYHVRIGTIGNSITHGVALPNPLTQAFPIVLDGMLEGVYGDTCIVKNFGLTTTTMLKNGDVSYWDTQHLKDYLAYAPEICFIMLGTNDSKPQNWDIYGDEYIADYLAMMDTIKARNPSTRFILAYPPPAYDIVWGISDSIIVHGVIPAIDSIAKVVDVEIMDFYYPLLDSVNLFPDKIHPNIEGNIVMAELLLDRIIKTDIIHKTDTGLTFITSFESNINPLSISSNAELSWTTINADSVYLDGTLVEKEGVMNVSPTETTTYTMIAMGQVGNDTTTITLEVYVQELSRLMLSPSRPTRDVGDTILIKVYHFDQFDLLINNNHPDVTWSIDGSGSLYEETSTSAYFICEHPDTTYLEVSYMGEVSSLCTIITRPYATGIAEKAKMDDFTIYPNPSDKLLFIRTDHPDHYSIAINSLNGQLIFSAKMEGPSHQINLSSYEKGVYFITIRSKDFVRTEKIIKL